jgi:hypothetical protein
MAFVEADERDIGSRRLASAQGVFPEHEARVQHLCFGEKISSWFSKIAPPPT